MPLEAPIQRAAAEAQIVGCATHVPAVPRESFPDQNTFGFVERNGLEAQGSLHGLAKADTLLFIHV